jgi:hypothetical protein
MNDSNLFLSFGNWKIPKPRYWQVGVGEGSLPAAFFSLEPHSVEGKGFLSDSFFPQVASLNTLTLGVRILTYEFGGYENIQAIVLSVRL